MARLPDRPLLHEVAEHLSLGGGDVDAAFPNGNQRGPQPPLHVLQHMQPVVRASEGEAFKVWRTPSGEPMIRCRRCSQPGAGEGSSRVGIAGSASMGESSRSAGWSAAGWWAAANCAALEGSDGY